MKKWIITFIALNLLFVLSSYTSGGLKMEQYPAPKNGLLKIITPYDLGESADLKIFNSTGRIVLHEELNRNILEVKVGTLSQGIYYGIIKNNFFTERFKFYKR